MRVLFIHNYFPGQFKNLAQHLSNRLDCEVIALHRDIKDGREMQQIDGIETLPFGDDVSTTLPANSPIYMTERCIREAVSLAYRGRQLRDRGWQPDLIYSHVSWGSSSFLHHVFPNAKYVKYCEWFYSPQSQTAEYLTKDPPFNSRLQTSMQNIPILAELERADALISPTHWQKSQFPAVIRSSLEVVPDGVDTGVFKPDPCAKFEVNGHRRLTRSDKVITYVARGADPIRGFKAFLQALKILQDRHPQLEAVIAGDRKVYYGPDVGTEKHFHHVLAEVKIDPSRTHFVGRLDYEPYRNLLKISAVHVYLTAPFVLSWSALEAMSIGCAVVGSDTAPVIEFIEDGKNGLLANFFSPMAIADKVDVLLSNGDLAKSFGAAARRKIIDTWSLEIARRHHEQIIHRLTKGAKDNTGLVRLRRR